MELSQDAKELKKVDFGKPLKDVFQDLMQDVMSSVISRTEVVMSGLIYQKMWLLYVEDLQVLVQIVQYCPKEVNGQGRFTLLF
jgi:hypothetical protein